MRKSSGKSVKNKPMKKYLAILLVILPMTIIITSCGKDDEPGNLNENVTLKFNTDFAAELVKRGYIKDANNIYLDELEHITTIDVSNTYDNPGVLTSLDGIECFANLTCLDCSYNQLTSLDISKNVKLTRVDCGSNQLQFLNVSKNTNLDFLWCDINKLTYIDVSKNIKLENLRCSSNQLKYIDVSKNTKLELLWCYDNQLASLDVSKNPKLIELSCAGNRLTSLDISNNTGLDFLWCEENPGIGGVFRVNAWFDNNTIPDNLKIGFSVDNQYALWWHYNGTIVNMRFQKVE